MFEAQLGQQSNGVELRRVPPAEVARGIAATPMNEYIVWTGGAYSFKPGSRTVQILSLVDQPWRPVAFRELMLRAARIGGELGFTPDEVRCAVRQHQRAKDCCYLWVRGSAHAGFALVADVPYPGSANGPWAKGREVPVDGALRHA